MKKRIVSIVLSATLVATAFTGCGGSGTSSDGSASKASTETKILGTGIYSASDNFNSYLGKAITNSSKGIFQTNVEDGQNDQSTQNNQVDTMLAKGASVVALSVVDVTAAPNLIQKCKNAGNVPIIFFNKEITDQSVMASYDKAYQVTSTGGDYGANIEAQEIVDAWKANKDMDKNHDGKLQIIDLMGDPGHTATKPRADAWKDTLTKAGVKYELLAEDTGMWVTATAKDKMDAWISKYGDGVECIICANDAMALGALSSVEAAGFNKQGTKSGKYIPIYGIDALPEILSKIQSGEIAGSVLQDSKTQGEVIVKIAQNLVNGKDATDGLSLKLEAGAKAVRVPYKAVTLENLDEAKAAYGS